MSRAVLIILVSALVMMGPFTNNIMVPSLPALAVDLRIDFGDAQAILSIYMVGFAAGQLFVGPMSDRFGRKPVLTMSLVLYIVASVLCSMAPDLNTLCAARLVQALGASATMSVGRAIIRDSFDSDRMAQVYAYIGAALALGPIVGPIFGEIGVILPMLSYFNVWTVILPFAGFAFGTGFVFPSGQAGGISPYPKMAGSASSMLSCLQMSTAAVIGAVTARMLDGSMMPMAWVVFGMGPVLLLSFYLLVLRHPRERTPANA